MNLESCHAPTWVPSHPPPNSAWAAATRIRGQLCRLCDLALDAKDGGKLSRFRRHELKIVRTLHDDFGRLELDTTHCTSATECDICRLARAAKRMVLSAYADECTTFIRNTRETKGGIAIRVNHDFTDDFRRYLMRSGLPEHSKVRQLMARAELVSQCLAMQIQNANAHDENTSPAPIRVIPNNPAPFIEEQQSGNPFSEIGHRVAVILGSHLRIVQPGSS